MVLPLIPLIIGGSLLGGGGWLAGKSASGGVDINTELLTKKNYTSQQFTDSRQTTNTSVYAPTISRTFDIQYNIASEGSSISTKKEQAISQQPNVSPSVTPTLLVVPTTAQGGDIGGSAGGSGASFDYMTIAVFGALGFGAYYLLKGKNKK